MAAFHVVGMKRYDLSGLTLYLFSAVVGSVICTNSLCFEAERILHRAGPWPAVVAHPGSEEPGDARPHHHRRPSHLSPALTWVAETAAIARSARSHSGTASMTALPNQQTVPPRCGRDAPMSSRKIPSPKDIKDATQAAAETAQSIASGAMRIPPASIELVTQLPDLLE